MRRFDWRGWTWLAITNFFLSIVFNKLLVRNVYYRDRTAADIVDRIEFKLINRLKYPGEL